MIKRTEDHEAKRELRKHKVRAFVKGGIFALCALLLIMNVFWGPTAGFLLKKPLTVIVFNSAYDIDYDMRNLALDMTKNCTVRTQDCVIIEIYRNLSQEVTYSNTPYNRYVGPTQTWKDRSGDCKALSGLYVNLLVNMGIVSYIDVNYMKQHAIAIVEPMGEDYSYLVDLTIPTIQRFGKGYDYWADYKVGGTK
jgi:hypothetical protein